MKIIGGKLKGRNFYMPKDVRPTPDKVRKAIFDILGQDLTDLSFIDLFAGSGAVGLEAISRGAAPVMFIENSIKGVEVINENLSRLCIEPYEESHLMPQALNIDVFAGIKHLSKQGKRFDLAFADPPFYQGLARKTLKTLAAYDILHPACFIILQHDKRDILPEKQGRFLVTRQKKYGTSHLTLYRGQ